MKHPEIVPEGGSPTEKRIAPDCPDPCTLAAFLETVWADEKAMKFKDDLDFGAMTEAKQRPGVPFIPDTINSVDSDPHLREAILAIDKIRIPNKEGVTAPGRREQPKVTGMLDPVKIIGGGMERDLWSVIVGKIGPIANAAQTRAETASTPLSDESKKLFETIRHASKIALFRRTNDFNEKNILQVNAIMRTKKPEYKNLPDLEVSKIKLDAEFEQYLTANALGGFVEEYDELNGSQEKVREKFAASIPTETFHKDVGAACKDARQTPNSKKHEAAIKAYKDWVGVNCA
jgi:hypothetical protein